MRAMAQAVVVVMVAAEGVVTRAMEVIKGTAEERQSAGGTCLPGPLTLGKCAVTAGGPRTRTSGTGELGATRWLTALACIAMARYQGERHLKCLNRLTI